MKSKLLLLLLRLVLAIVIVIGGGWLGMIAGSAFGYLIAFLTGRDPAELKDMLIWGTITGCAVFVAAGLWAMLHFTRAGKWAQRIAIAALVVVMTGGGALMIATFDWPKSSGTPIVNYELRLPVGTPLPGRGDIDITIWSERSGQGCYLDRIRMAGERPEITGNCTLYLSNTNPMVSLRLNNKTENYWPLPYKPDTPLEKTFGTWRRIEFIPTPRENVPPLPPGDYDIRYHVRKYM